MTLPIAIIGAGPIGLAAAAHLLRAGLDVVILEAGATPAAAVNRWGHVRLFSPWRECIDEEAAAVLSRHGWKPPRLERYPTGAELRDRYLLPLAATDEFAARLRLRARVRSVSRVGHDKTRESQRRSAPFELTLVAGGREERLRAGAVVDASGTLDTPNPLGGTGLPASGEAALRGRISYGIPDVRAEPARYTGKRVLVVGSGHSAMTVVTDLASLRRTDGSIRIVWATRNDRSIDLQSTGGGVLPKRDELVLHAADLARQSIVERVAPIVIERVSLDASDSLVVEHADGCLPAVDHVIAATGFRPDSALLGELRVVVDARFEAPVRLAPLIDPAKNSCGTVPLHGATELSHPEPGLFIVGLKSYGRAPTFLMRTGYEQVRSVAAALAGESPARAYREPLIQIAATR